MLVSDIMSTDVARVVASTTFADAAARLQETGWSELAVTDDDGNLVGVLAVGDVLRALVPDVDELFRLGGSLKAAFAAFLEMGQGLFDQAIGRVVIADPIVIGPDAPLLNAATVMISSHIHRLFVVEDGKLVGTIGRADVCVGALRPGD